MTDNHPTRTPSWAEQYGEDLGPAPFQDLDLDQAQSTAQRHAAGRRNRDQAAAHRRHLAQLDQAAKDQADQDAYDQAIGLRTKGQDVPRHIAAAAARHALKTRPAVPTARQLADQVQARRRSTPPTDAA